MQVNEEEGVKKNKHGMVKIECPFQEKETP